jgi:hypothetical protein
MVAVLVAAMAWCAPAGAATVSGSLKVTSIDATTVSFTFTVKRTCAGGEQCDYFSEIDQLTDDGPCPAGRPNDPWILWTGDVQNTGPTTERGQATPRGWGGTAPVGRSRLCLYTYADGVYYLVDDSVIAHPGEGATTPGGDGTTPGGSRPGAGPGGTSKPSGNGSPTKGACARYAYQQSAQTALKADPSLAARLDRNGNGVACESLRKRKRYVPTVALRRAALAARAGLRKMYGSSFTERRRYHERCARVTRTRVRCSVSWRHGGTWKGSVHVVGRLRKNKRTVIVRPHVLRPV